GSIYQNGSTDGKDLGADTGNLPLIHNLQTTAGPGTASWSSELSAPIQHVPCALEVSPDISLERHTGPYQVVDDVNPLRRAQADSDRRSGNVVDGPRRAYFLNLTPGTRFYYRLMCGGDMRIGSFETLSAPRQLNFAPIRVNAGGTAHVDNRGQAWLDDTGFTGGGVVTTNLPVSGTENSSVFQNHRRGAHSYRFAAPNGDYSVKLMFSEPVPGEATYRLFNVKINGQAVLTNFNIAMAAGGVLTAVERTFNVAVTAEEILVSVEAVRGYPMLSGLEITGRAGRTVSMNTSGVTLTGSQTFGFAAALDGVAKPASWSIDPAVGAISSGGLYSAPLVVGSVQRIQVTGMLAEAPGQPVTEWITLVPGTAGVILPVRTNAGGPVWTDAQGFEWASDRAVTGGPSSATTLLVTGTASSPLYQDARLGVHGYQFPVPAGNYTVRLKFAEYQYTAAQKRDFNVTINGQAVLTNFDIFSAAGGAMKAVDREFTATAVNGLITIQAYFGSAGNAQINAVEVVQQ
ncbi:MAG: hypothetical protein H7Y20_08335, partial [Bryobacteraceae bacterium]|nr:hypothetical protein [Bryobacteraceae bacterium]